MPVDKENKEDDITYPMKGLEPFEPWIDEEASFSEHPSRKVINGLFDTRYWYETRVDDIPPLLVLVFATVQDMKRQERYEEYPPEALMQWFITPKPDLDRLREDMDYYDYDNFKSGKIR